MKNLVLLFARVNTVTNTKVQGSIKDTIYWNQLIQCLVPHWQCTQRAPFTPDWESKLPLRAMWWIHHPDKPKPTLTGMSAAQAVLVFFHSTSCSWTICKHPPKPKRSHAKHNIYFHIFIFITFNQHFTNPCLRLKCQTSTMLRKQWYHSFSSSVSVSG